MYYTYPRTIRVYRLSRGMQMALELVVAVSSALCFSYLILHGML
jgi:hypothetical protein